MSTYTIVLEGNDHDSWSGLVPDLPGLLLMGDTRSDLLERAPAVIADYVRAMRETGLPVPHPGEHVAQVQVPAVA